MHAVYYRIDGIVFSECFGIEPNCLARIDSYVWCEVLYFTPLITTPHNISFRQCPDVHKNLTRCFVLTDIERGGRKHCCFGRSGGIESQLHPLSRRACLCAVGTPPHSINNHCTPPQYCNTQVINEVVLPLLSSTSTRSFVPNSTHCPSHI